MSVNTAEFRCDRCGAGPFTTKGGLTHHKTVMHKASDIQRYACLNPKCGRVFSSELALRMHTRRAHGDLRPGKFDPSAKISRRSRKAFGRDGTMLLSGISRKVDHGVATLGEAITALEVKVDVLNEVIATLKAMQAGSN